ncbi:MAG TPA: 50S ribosomal protein L10 [Bryobacteraceae bacterium]|nr:50S ribosomal protein L10 [Bryobacteraceae bacterium]
MKKREDKKKDFEELRKALESVRNVFITGYEKITVDQDYNLRKAVRGVGGSYKVIKNNVAEKASVGLPAEPVFQNLKGMTSIAWTEGDPVALAKALTAYAKTTPAFTFKAGFVEGRAVDIKAITELASMPPKEEIFAKLLYVISAPASQLVRTINAVGRDLAVVVDQGVQNNKFQS